MTEVTPHTGYYLVRLVGPHGIRAHLVGKDKHCSCGGSGRRPCSHIGAVADYLRAGGEPASCPDTDSSVRDSRRVRTGNTTPDVCPICEASIDGRNNGLWRCSRDNTHYWQWRGEQNGGAIRKFLTQPHPNKRGPFYQMTEAEREAFLLRAAQRMHEGGYTPHKE